MHRMNRITSIDPHLIQGFIFDLDGTVYLGDQALPGAVESIAELRRVGKQVVYLSNKPLEAPQTYAAKLTLLGIPTSPEQVITSSMVLARYLARIEPDLAYYVIGEDYLKNELSNHGLKVVGELTDQDEKTVIDPAGIEAVIVAFDRSLDYRKLNTAYQALVRGAHFYATNPDRTCPMPGGGIPDAGATIAALEFITGRKVELVAGKPSRLMLQFALECLGLPPERCLLAGDRLETDIVMAQQAGILNALVLTGATNRIRAEASEPPPDLILENLGELRDYFRPALWAELGA